MKKNKWDRIKSVLSNNGYTDDQIQIIEDRIYNEICKAEHYSIRLYVFHIILVFISLISTILISLFISVEKIIGSITTAGTALFWTALALSVIVHIVHEILFVFNISKKLVLYSSLKEKFKSELWKFASGVDKYKSLDKHQAFLHLCTKFEKMKNKFDQANIEIIAGNTQNGKSSQYSNPGYGRQDTASKLKIRTDPTSLNWGKSEIEPISKYESKSFTP